LSIVEFTADWRELKEPVRVEKGFGILSQPIGEKRTRCHYTTTQPLTLQPLSLARAGISTEPDGRSLLRLRFECSPL
ncbi:type VI secretion system baseplate subunit TssF, partial [Klebsiella pneumoniae]